jgi:enoyl-[acyl-carrier protein] reductase III
VGRFLGVGAIREEVLELEFFLLLSLECVKKSEVYTVSDQKQWALILGASSGFGAATARALAKSGFSIVGVHLDRKATMPAANAVVADIEAAGQKALFCNVNAASDERRAEVLDKCKESFGPDDKIVVLLHSLAFGTLKPYFPAEGAGINSKNMNMTLDVMAHSLVYWTQDVVARGLMGRGGRIYAMTSAGSERVWTSYGAVSAAKAALESHIRQLALELAPRGITANAIKAGVTDTPALRKIPGNENMLEVAKTRNPAGRLTTPEDIARSIVILCHADLDFMTGNVINIDGGENICE